MQSRDGQVIDRNPGRTNLPDGQLADEQASDRHCSHRHSTETRRREGACYPAESELCKNVFWLSTPKLH